MKVCVNCGKEFKRNSNRQKYCPKCRCKKLYNKNYIEKIGRDNWNKQVLKYMEKYRLQWQILKIYRYEAIGKAYREHGNLMNQYHCGKGTGSLGPHPNTDFEREKELVKKEMKRLNISNFYNTEL
jgi:hypothetical protein